MTFEVKEKVTRPLVFIHIYLKTSINSCIYWSCFLIRKHRVRKLMSACLGNSFQHPTQKGNFPSKASQLLMAGPLTGSHQNVWSPWCCHRGDWKSRKPPIFVKREVLIHTLSRKHSSGHRSKGKRPRPLKAMPLRYRWQPHMVPRSSFWLWVTHASGVEQSPMWNMAMMQGKTHRV